MFLQVLCDVIVARETKGIAIGVLRFAGARGFQKSQLGVGFSQHSIAPILVALRNGCLLFGCNALGLVRQRKSCAI